MLYLTCDMCKKMIASPVKDDNYFTLKTMHVCRKCKLGHDREMEDNFEKERDPYDFVQKKAKYVAVVEAKCKK